MGGRKARVLVGIDFSEGSMAAIREGRWLSSRAGLELRLIHVAENGTPWTPDAHQWEWMRVAPVEPGIVLVRQGRPWVEIVRYAREIAAAVVVLGTHGASGIQMMSLGSTASRVAVRAPCPVLFVARRPLEESPTSQPNTLQEQL